MSYTGQVALNNTKKIDKDLKDVGTNVKDFMNISATIADGFNNAYNHVASNSNGGVLIIPPGDYKITKKIIFNKKNVVVKASGHATRLIADAEMDIMVEYNSATGGYGHRGGGIENMLIDGKNLANYGLVIGHGAGTVVGENFTNIRVQGTKKYGIVFDACQNNYFSLLDIENCGGGLLLLNGAGNNVVMKSEFATAVDLNSYLLEMRSDNTFPGYNNNAFANQPQGNKFYGCVFERGSALGAVRIGEGRQNALIDCEFSTSSMTVAAIVLETDAVLTKIEYGRFAGGNTNKPGIINRGFNTIIERNYFENFAAEEIHIYNRTILGSNHTNRTPRYARIKNLGGDIGANLNSTSPPRFIGSDTTLVEPYVSEFYHDNRNQLFFQARSKTQQIVTGKNIKTTIASPSGTNHTATINLSQGSWLIDVMVANGDYNHTRSMTYIARFKTASTNILADLQPLGTEVVTGTIVANLSVTINNQGVVSVSSTTSSATTTTINISAVCQIEY